MRSRRAVTIVCVGLLLVLGWAYSRPSGWRANSDGSSARCVTTRTLEKIDLEPFIAGIGVVTNDYACQRQIASLLRRKTASLSSLRMGYAVCHAISGHQPSVLSGGAETGLLGLAFAPDYAESGVFYVSYIDLENRSALSRLTVSADPNVANSQPELLLAIQQPSYPGAGNIHNGGDLQFDRTATCIGHWETVSQVARKGRIAPRTSRKCWVKSIASMYWGGRFGRLL